MYCNILTLYKLTLNPTLRYNISKVLQCCYTLYCTVLYNVGMYIRDHKINCKPTNHMQLLLLNCLRNNTTARIQTLWWGCVVISNGFRHCHGNPQLCSVIHGVNHVKRKSRKSQRQFLDRSL